MDVLVVDAANVIGSRPDGWWRDRPGAARRLLTKLTALQHQLPQTTIAVILEGAARKAIAPTDSEADSGPADAGQLRVILAPASGDDTITETTATYLAEVPRPSVTVVTADRGLRQRVEPLGATTTGPGWLWTQLDNL